MGDERERLVGVMRSQADDREPWEWAETCVFEALLRERLALLRVVPGPDVGVALMAAAMLIAEAGPEWGGDFRDALGRVAELGLSLVDEEPGGDGL